VWGWINQREQHGFLNDWSEHLPFGYVIARPAFPAAQFQPGIPLLTFASNVD
jgi:hypothetical protein